MVTNIDPRHIANINRQQTAYWIPIFFFSLRNATPPLPSPPVPHAFRLLLFRTCGIHVFVFYVVALSFVLAMSTACLTATESGYFYFQQEVDSSKIHPAEGRKNNEPPRGSVAFQVSFPPPSPPNEYPPPCAELMFAPRRI